MLRRNRPSTLARADPGSPGPKEGNGEKRGSMKLKSWSTKLRQKSRLRGSGDTIGTIAFYGPDNRHASKVAVGIQPESAGEVTFLERWYEDQLDVRIDRGIGKEVEAFLQKHGVRRVAVAEGIIGCPHEEGIDYPEDDECPQCPFWQGKDRFEHAVPE